MAFLDRIFNLDLDLLLWTGDSCCEDAKALDEKIVGVFYYGKQIDVYDYCF